MTSRLFITFSLSALVVACRSTPTRELKYDQDSPWEFYRQKYDADASGDISEEEYDSERSAFAPLDRTGDGLLTEEDFVPSGGDMRGMEIEMRAMRAMFEYLQEAPEQEGDEIELAMDELFFAAEAYDTDDDEALTESEFRAVANSRYRPMPEEEMARMMGERDPWDSLIAGVDGNEDDAVSFPELERFFDDLDDGDFVLYFTMDDPRGGTTAREPQTGPRVGTLAPDFELAPIGGGERVRLSDFAGERPVALIFGSYT